MTINETKPTNPKDAIGSNKIPMHLWPETATVLGALGLLDGALKYGRSNFREIGVRASIYYDAAKRHLNAWFEGEECDPDSKLPHLAHALACIAIIVDAEAAGKLNDDRMVEGGYREFIDKLTPHVERLKAQHADKSPKHYSISDSRKQPLGVAEYAELLAGIDANKIGAPIRVPSQQFGTIVGGDVVVASGGSGGVGSATIRPETDEEKRARRARVAHSRGYGEGFLPCSTACCARFDR